MKNKKRSAFLGTIGAAGLALIAAIPSMQNNTVVKDSLRMQTTTIEKQKPRESAPVQQTPSTKANDQLPSRMGGMTLGGKSWGFGISPKDYGMYHVRRGTHKRSNKK